MAYSTLADLDDKIDESELIAATDDDDTGAVILPRVDAAIASADAEIDGYLGGRYPVPLNPVPPILRSLSVDMAIYHVYLRRMGPPEHRTDQYKNSINFLRLVAKGDVSLGVDDPAGNANDDRPEFSGSERVFSRESMKGW